MAQAEESFEQVLLNYILMWI